MRPLFIAYRVLAMIVGILLTLMVIGMVMKYGLADGSGAQHFGDTMTGIVALCHGWIYIVYVVVAFVLARKAGWDLPFILQMFVAGLIPLVIFWVERRVVAKLRTELPELAHHA